VAIIRILQSVLSRSGQVAVEPRLNALIVTDVPEVFPQIEQLIAELDKKAPQVMIETQIVEIDSTRSKDLGLEWGGSNGELGTFTAGQRDTSFPMQLPNDLTKTRFLDPVTNVLSSVGGATGAGAAGGAGVGAAAGTGLFGSSLKTSVLDLTQLAVTLRALVSRSEARFLGKPKILTLNNKGAIIQILQKTAVFKAQTQGGIGVAGTAQVERFDTGLILKVTPQVNKEGYITMLMQPMFTDVQEAAVSDSAQRVFDPITRAASTLVRVKNGQTLVMGGLLQSTESKIVRKVPFLGYIPLIGWLFTSNSTTRRNSDLVIFLTPTIVND
jgi:type II secretory pathway component GspD/PulD (secretin)